MDSPYLKRIIITNEEMPAITGLQTKPEIRSYNTMIKQGSTEQPASSCIDIDLASLVYTSGSTGTPKGVMLTHLNMVSAANSITQYLENTSDDIILDTLPLAFDYGLYQVLMAFKCGATVILEKAFVYPQQVVNTVVKERVTGWPIVPTIAAILLRLKDLGRHDFSSLRYITTTGQAMPPKHLQLLHQTFPGVKIFSMYGLTECKRVSYLPPEELEKRPGSVGKAMPNTEVYLVDEKDREINEAGVAGELVVRGANVMKGYWNLPGETAKSLRPGRYPGETVLYTGDLFKQDREGYLYFLGRKDDIIKTAGHMVSPKEVENVLCEKEDVVEAAVIGVDDEILGKAVTAFVQLADSSLTTAKDIIDFCSERLENFAVPKSVVLLSALPKTNTGKIAKRELQP
jgi:long-chain acyl-CoA synthetase